MTLDENALEQALLAEPKNGEDWFDTVAGATGFTDEENRTLLRCAISAYLKALEGAGMVIEQGWQPIETAPRDDTQVLVWSKPEDGFSHVQRRIDRWRNGNWYHSRLAMPPTHWRPLPAPPAMLSAAEPAK